jgi:GNAT superfamily N-acetyltransferase
MDDAALASRVFTLLQAETRLWATSHPGASAFTRPGLLASVMPATPDRSMFNWVVPDDLAALDGAYTALSAGYAAAGVRAFTVWVQPGDEAMQHFLLQRGHKLDSSPISMAAPLAELTLADAGDLDFDETRDLNALARLNDAAFGLPPPAFAAALQQWGPQAGWRGHLARHQGQLAASVMSWESPEGDLGITGVATLPLAQGTGLATRLLSQVLREARERGLLTTSLQASPRGRGVYAKLGYRELGTLGMWEHRVPAP